MLQEGSIGKDLVIKPLPKHLRKAKQLIPDLSDDELFLNQDDLNSEVSIDTGLPIHRNNKRSRRSAINLNEHVIYKRKLNEEEYYGDYGKIYKTEKYAKLVNKTFKLHFSVYGTRSFRKEIPKNS